jgi:dTDP-4-amino-4,6-dideoxygalactose transaminase
MIEPREVPRLPVLDWQGFGFSAALRVPSVADGPAHVFTSSGRAAIMLCLESLGVREGGQVLGPTSDCPSTVAPIIAVGAKPVFLPDQ